MARSAGQAAYERWCEIINPQPPHRFMDRLPLRPWEKLTKHTRQVWESIAVAAIKAKRKT